MNDKPKDPLTGAGRYGNHSAHRGAFSFFGAWIRFPALKMCLIGAFTVFLPIIFARSHAGFGGHSMLKLFVSAFATHWHSGH